MAGKLQLGYWNIRGLAQSIRYVLEYTGSAWEDVLYCQAGPNDSIPFDKSCWFEKKEVLGLDFPNLPYFVDEKNGIKITQSQTILRYVARIHPELNLCGTDLVSQTHVDLVLAEFSDCKGRMTGLQYSAGVEGPGAEFITGEDSSCLRPSLQRFSVFLGNKPWFAGNSLTLADFVMFEYLICASLYNNAYLLSVGQPTTIAGAETNPDGRGAQALLTAYPNLQAFKDRFEAIPAIAAYLVSDRYDAVRKMNNQHAKFR
jgi:glutathione S-transferase